MITLRGLLPVFVSFIIYKRVESFFMTKKLLLDTSEMI